MNDEIRDVLKRCRGIIEVLIPNGMGPDKLLADIDRLLAADRVAEAEREAAVMLKQLYDFGFEITSRLEQTAKEEADKTISYLASLLAARDNRRAKEKS